MKDYYAILEINEAASKEVIEKVHKLLIKRYHPDLEQDPNKKLVNEEKMKEINEAYELLTDVDKKKEYDAELKEYKIQQIMEEIRSKQDYTQENENNNEDNDEYEETSVNMHHEEYFQQSGPIPCYTNNMQYQAVSDEEIRRQAQVYYDELYKQYLIYNGYYTEPEDFKTVAKRYLTVFLTIIVVLVILYIIYVIPSTNELLKDVVSSNALLNGVFGQYFK